MRKLHLALGVSNIQQSIDDYSARLGTEPVVIIQNEYALWRTDILNLSIRRTDVPTGFLRHLGWENPTADEFSSEIDCNGIIWENFAAIHQASEINETWPDTDYQPT